MRNDSNFYTVLYMHMQLQIKKNYLHLNGINFS